MKSNEVIITIYSRLDPRPENQRPQAGITGTNTKIWGPSKEVQAMEESYGLAV